MDQSFIKPKSYKIVKEREREYQMGQAKSSRLAKNSTKLKIRKLINFT